MPINQSLMDNLYKQYGKEKGTRVYFQMAQKGRVKGEKIHVKSYTRKKHGTAKFGGKVSSHNKSGRAYVDISYGVRGREYVKKLKELGIDVDVFPMKGESGSRRMRINPSGRTDIELMKKKRALAEEYKDVRY